MRILGRLGMVSWLFMVGSCLPAAGNAFVRAGLPYAVDVWETDAGLPQNSVISMVQSRDGYLWLGTINGLVRFDGRTFEVFDENNTPGLKTSRVVHLFEDSLGRLWIGMDGQGVVYLEDGRLISPAELSLGGPERNVVASCEDDQGSVWLVCANGEIWRCQDGQFSLFILPPPEPSKRRWIIKEPDGTLWVGTDRRQCAVGSDAVAGTLQLPVAEEVPVLQLDQLLPSRQGGYWRLANGRVQYWQGSQLIKELGPYPWGNAPVSIAIEDAQGNLVVGTLGAGLFWFDEAGQATAVTTRNGLSNNFILSLLNDREGNLWIGTDGGGLNRVRRQAFHLAEQTRGMVIQSSWPDPGQGVWIGANSGGLGHWTNGPLTLFLANLQVRSVLVDPQTNLWAGTRGAGLWIRSGESFQRASGEIANHPVIQALHQDASGRLWVGTQSGLGRLEEGRWAFLTVADGLSSDVITALADHQDGTLWVGTDGGGLNRFSQQQWTSLRREDAEGPGSDRVTSLLLDAEGTLWVATSSGLACFRKERWHRLTRQDGLISNSLGYLLEDTSGHLWIGSNLGLMRVAKKALLDYLDGQQPILTLRTYAVRDGLPSAECTTGSQPGACQSPDGRLWFPTIKGLAWIHPARLPHNTNPPPVVIQAVWVDGQRQGASAPGVPAPGEVVLPPRRDRLEIQYTSLSLTAPDQTRFKYRLAGLDAAWTDAGNSRVVRYPSLPPGQYQFEVAASNEDGVWSLQPATLAVFVQPPFWRTPWFIACASLVLLALTALSVHRISTRRLQQQVALMKQQEAVEKERARIARDIHDQLGANLTQIALLGELVESDKDSPTEIEDHARIISGTARDMTRTLDEIVWTVNPSNDTLEGLVNYICKYAQDYLAVAGIRYRLEAPPQVPDIPIPPEVRHNVYLAAKEAVTNVVRHAQASTARLKITVAPGQFQIEIADDGRGLPGMDQERMATRNGLRNMRKRMEDIGGRCEIDAASEGGLSVRFSVPIAQP